MRLGLEFVTRFSFASYARSQRVFRGHLNERLAGLGALLLALVALTGCVHGSPGGGAPGPFASWPKGASPREVGERVAANFLPRGHMLTPQDGTIHYSEACTWYGALTFAKLAGDTDLTSNLVSRFEPLFDPANSKIVPTREHVDYAVFGIVPLELYIQTKQPRYLAMGMERADAQWAKPIDGGLSGQTRFWIDDMYMISILQTQAFRATGDPRYLNRAALEMVAYLDKLQQTNGLFLHGAKGPFFWGRGNGWMAAGMTELLRDLPANHPQRARILDGYHRMMAALLQTQDAEGMWHQLVDRPDAWPETSGTGMFTFAMITGVKNGWLDEATYGPAARKGWLALVNHLDAAANMRNVCAGMGQRPTADAYLQAKQATGDFHGQAPVLWCASALLR
jgi:unsaturated rhamnogalacturonyl hydrolase